VLLLLEARTGERAGGCAGQSTRAAGAELDIFVAIFLFVFVQTFVAYDFESAPMEQVLPPPCILLARKSLSNPSVCFCSSFFV